MHRPRWQTRRGGLLPTGLVLKWAAALAAALAMYGQESKAPSTYALGPDDQIMITALDAEEVTTKAPIRIDSRGNITLPMVGRLKAAGLTPEQLEAAIEDRLKKYLQQPDVTVSLTEMRSQPISILGAVQNPGVHQLQGRKTLFEVISMAGGIRQDAGYQIKITRRKEWGSLPLPNAQDDPSGQFSIGSVSIKAIMDATTPAENIDVRPNDVISVPKGQLVYVIGAVRKVGGYVMGENESISALQILSLCEGLDRFANPRLARIMRPVAGNSQQRREITVDLKALIAGKSADIKLQAEDILFVPSSAKKAATIRGIETAIGLGTSVTSGLIIFRR